MIKVGDLVRIKHTDIVALVTRIEFKAEYYNSITRASRWVFLAGHNLPRKSHRLEVVNESR